MNQRKHPIGYLESFDTGLIAKLAEDYVNADEVERALWLLDNLPGLYRDQVPLELQKLKQDILAAMITPHGYLTSNLDSETNSPEQSVTILHLFMRAILVRLEVERYNAKGITPHIVDVGPGEYFIPLGLMRLGAKFTYHDVAMDPRTGEKARPQLENYLKAKPDVEQPVIFIAMEIIEHLPEPKDLVVEALRHCGRMPDRLHISTPCYTFDGSKKDWRKPCGLPHLRTYTPKELVQVVDKLFPGYLIELYYADILSVRACRADSPDIAISSSTELRDIVSKTLSTMVK